MKKYNFLKFKYEADMNFLEEKFYPNQPSKMFLMELAAQKNNQPLLPIRQNYGLRLPNDRFCQVQPNFSYDDQSTSNNSHKEIPNSQPNLKRYNSNFSEMNTESVMMNLDSSQQRVKRRKLEEQSYDGNEQQNEENNDLLRDNYYD